jgi:hypothetical protein
VLVANCAFFDGQLFTYNLDPCRALGNTLEVVCVGGEMALAAGSPAIDGADAAFCPATDVRGVARPVDGEGNGVAACDVGAYEWGELTAWAYLPMVVADLWDSAERVLSRVP